MSGFDYVAPLYDSLARLVFGKSIVDAQTYFLNQIPPHARVLILGGGTGWLLERLLRAEPTCFVWYVEKSSKMIERSRKRKTDNRVYFIHGTEENIPADLKFDVIITNFYLDLFLDSTLQHIMQHIHLYTLPTTRWLVSEFVNSGKWWHRWLLKVMYFFFRMVCNIEANQLPPWHQQMQRGWVEINAGLWYGNFIRSNVWQRLDFPSIPR
jgi:ubiquinone/menaquinone biosynthesis C-methylase UbiE